MSLKTAGPLAITIAVAVLALALLVTLAPADATAGQGHGNRGHGDKHKVRQPKVKNMYLVDMGATSPKTRLCVAGKFDIARVTFNGKHIGGQGLMDDPLSSSAPQYGPSWGCTGPHYSILVPLVPGQACYEVDIKASRGEKKHKRTKRFRQQVCLP